MIKSEHIEKILVDEIQLPSKLAQNFKQKEIDIAVSAIRKFGLPVPLVIDKNKKIVLGELYYIAAKNLKLETVPSLFIENLEPNALKALRIAFIKIQKFGEFDFDELKTEVLEVLNDSDLDFTFEELGFDAISFDKLLFVEDKKEVKDQEEEQEQEGEIVLSDVAQIVRTGDLIELGPHRLLCADSLDEGSFKLLLKDEKADIIITDPPYNVKIQNNVTSQKQHKEFEQASGEMSEEEFERFLNQSFKLLKTNSKDTSLHYIFMDWRHCLTLQLAAKDVYLKLQNICVWDKTKAGMGSFYRSQHEFCFVYQNSTGKHINNIQLGSNGRNRSNVWNYPGMNISTKQARKLSKLHPTVKPTAMLLDILLDASKQNDIVLDTFGGSGSTLIAAEQCKRKARLIELSPHYCNVIISRWEELTGKKHKILSRAEDRNGKE